MLGILADNTDNAVPLDNLAFIAYAFNAGPDLHRRFLRKVSKKFCTTPGQPSSTMLQVARLDMAALREAVVVVHLQLRLNLGHGIEIDADQDEQRRTA